MSSDLTFITKRHGQHPDELVYAFYGLTEEEIKIVKGEKK
jgi:hypothetical protein